MRSKVTFAYATLSSGEIAVITFWVAAAAFSMTLISALTLSMALIALVMSFGIPAASVAIFFGSALARSLSTAGGSFANFARSPKALVTESISDLVIPTRKAKSVGVNFASASNVGLETSVKGFKAGQSFTSAARSAAGKLMNASNPPTAARAILISVALSPTRNERSAGVIAARASSTGRGAEARRAISGSARPIAANFAGSVFSMGANESRASTAALILSSGIPVTFEISARATWRTALRKSTGVAFGHLEPKFSPYGPATHSVYGRAARALRVGSIDDLVADEVTDASGVDHTTLRLEVVEGSPAKALSMFCAVVEEAPGRAKLSLKVPANRIAPKPISTISRIQAIRARTG